MATKITTGSRPWTARALCSGRDPNRWFPEREEGKSNVGHSAKKICAACPVSKHCLTYAVENHEESGIWGGCGEKDRRFLYRKWNKRECAGRGWLEGCECPWCLTLDLAINQRSTVFNSNGEGATHGIRVTYARGCRCYACKMSASLYSLEQRSIA